MTLVGTHTPPTPTPTPRQHQGLVARPEGMPELYRVCCRPGILAKQAPFTQNSATRGRARRTLLSGESSQARPPPGIWAHKGSSVLCFPAQPVGWG